MSLTRRRVLILCDDLQTARLLVDHVRAPHLDLVTCSEFEEASRLIDRDRFDVVISNFELSRADSFEGMSWIRRVASRFPEAQVILVCSCIDQTVRDLGKTLGATALIDRSAGLGPLRDLVTAEPAAPGGHSSEDPESTTGSETVNEFLRDQSISAVLRPIVALTGRAGRRVHFGVEGLQLGPGSPVIDPEVLFGHVDRTNRLLEFELRCIEAVLVEACQLPLRGKVFVNIRPRTLFLPDFAPEVKALARRHGHHESDLVLGLAEWRQMPNSGALVSTLRTLRDRGFGVVLSGYGPEYLDLLEPCAMDYFRIDGRLTRGLPDDRRSRTMIRVIVEKASSVGVETIAAGIETEPELECVRELGVDLAQGGYFSEAMSGRELSASFEAALPESRALVSHPFESDAEHELSNFLTAIALMAAQGMKKLTADDPLYADLEQIQSAGERAVELTQEIRLSALPEVPPSSH